MWRRDVLIAVAPSTSINDKPHCYLFSCGGQLSRPLPEEEGEGEGEGGSGRG